MFDLCPDSIPLAFIVYLAAAARMEPRKAKAA